MASRFRDTAHRPERAWSPSCVTAEPGRGPAGGRPHAFLLAGRHPGTGHVDTAAAATTDYALDTEHAGFAEAWIADHRFIGYGVYRAAVVAANIDR